MTGELLKRMGRWLAYFEPHQLELDQIGDAWDLALKDEFPLCIAHGVGDKFAVDQGALFNLAWQIADARGLEFRIHKFKVPAAPVPGHFAPMPTLQINMQASDPSQNWVNLEIHEGFEHVGYHMADALLRALGADWQTREPDGAQS